MVLLCILLPAYISMAYVHSQRRTLEVAQSIDATHNISLVDGISRISWPALAAFALAGFLYAAIANVPGTILQFFSTTPTARAMISGQLMIWTLMAMLLYMRTHAAKQFRAASEMVPVDIFETSNLRAFAQVSLTDVLIVVAGLVLSTVQSLDFSFRLDNYSKALIVLVPTLAYISIYPIWGLHKTMKQMQKSQLEELNSLITAAPRSLSPDDVTHLERLLQRRERVTAAPVWPIDITFLQRLLIYIIVPPLAWVGAALVETLIDGMIVAG